MSPTAPGALESEDLNARVAVVHVSSLDVAGLAILLFTQFWAYCLTGRKVRAPQIA